MKSNIHQFIIAQFMVAMTVIAGLSAPAFAYRGEAINLSMIRHEAAKRPAGKLVRIEGALSCNLGTENNGQGCALRLEEAGTGKIFNLVEAANAMRLFQDGSRKVAVEGTMADAETIQVKEARTL